MCQTLGQINPSSADSTSHSLQCNDILWPNMIVIQKQWQFVSQRTEISTKYQLACKPGTWVVWRGRTVEWSGSVLSWTASVLSLSRMLQIQLTLDSVVVCLMIIHRQWLTSWLTVWALVVTIISQNVCHRLDSLIFKVTRKFSFAFFPITTFENRTTLLKTFQTSGSFCLNKWLGLRSDNRFHFGSSPSG